MVVVVVALALEAVDALARMDGALGLDRLHGTLHLADPALPAALAVALEPLELPQAGRERERSAQRAQVAAEERAR